MLLLQTTNIKVYKVLNNVSLMTLCDLENQFPIAKHVFGVMPQMKKPAFGW